MMMTKDETVKWIVGLVVFGPGAANDDLSEKYLGDF